MIVKTVIVPHPTHAIAHRQTDCVLIRSTTQCVTN